MPSQALTREVYDTKAGIESKLSDLESFDAVIHARYEAGYKHKEQLGEFIVMGRYAMDTCGNFGFLDKVYAAPRVCTYDEFMRLGVAKHRSVHHSGRPHARQWCKYCHQRWTLETYHDNVAVGDQGSYAHKHCRYLATVWEDKKQFVRIFELAGFTALQFHAIPNGYWPDPDDRPYAGPWYAAETPWGVIKIGWRKRVIEIDWSATPARHTFADDVTKTDSMIHAWSQLDAMRYLAGVLRLLAYPK